MKEARLWSVVHSALMDALERNASVQRAKTVWQSDSDGFVDYKGLIDINTMATNMAKDIGGALEEFETYKRLHTKYGSD